VSSTPNFDFCRSIRLADKMDVVFLVDVVGTGFGVTIVYPKDGGSLDFCKLPTVYRTRDDALREIEDIPLSLIMQVQ